MGACASVKEPSRVTVKKATYRAVLSKRNLKINLVREEEIKALEMIFEDLSSRSFLRKINR